MRVTVITLLTLFVPCVGYAQGILSGQRGLSSARTGQTAFTIQDAVPPAPLAQDASVVVPGNALHTAHGTYSEGHGSNHCDGCNDGCGDGCNSCATCGGRRCCKFSYLHAPRDMVQHLPYDAVPKTYYYFRPYNVSHIWVQQQQAMEAGLDPKFPYSNAIFKDVFAKVDPKNKAEQIQPGR